MLLKDNSRQFPENPVASDPHCHCESTGSTPGGRTKIPEVLTAWHGQKEKKSHSGVFRRTYETCMK